MVHDAVALHDRPMSAAGVPRLPDNPVVVWAIAMQGAVLAASLVIFPLLGLSLAWRTVLPNAGFLAVLLSVWVFYVRRAPQKVLIAETLLATFLIVLFTNIGGAAQYGGVALGLPLADPWLAAADAALGIHVPTLTAWTAQHPWFTLALVLAYFSLLPQFVLPIMALGLFYRDREGLWEYVFHFHFCLLVTLVGVALFPAACAFTYYGFTSLIDQTRFIEHFAGLRAGTFTVISFDNIEGMITFPSFHTAGGMMVTWAFRQRRWWAAALIALNALLIAATVLTGAHYGVDVLMTALLFLCSVLVWRRWLGPRFAAVSGGRHVRGR